MSSKERNILFNLLEAYKDMPYLWHKNHANYNSRTMRNTGYQVLLKIYRRLEPDANLDHLKKKIDNMRTTYLREEKKVVALKREGEEYVPTLWYYDALSFLGSPVQPSSPAKDPLKNENKRIPLSEDEEDEDTDEPSSSRQVFYNKRKRKSQLGLGTQDIPITSPAEKRQRTSNMEADWEILGRSIGIQLRDLDRKALTITQKIISDAIYYAKIGRLTEDAYIDLGIHESLGTSYKTVSQSNHSGDEDWKEEVLLESPSPTPSMSPGP